MASSTRSCMLFTWSMYIIAKWSPVYQGASNVWNPRLAMRYIFTRQPAILPYSDKRKQVTTHPNLRKLWFLLDLAYSTSIPSLEQKHSSCWKIFKSRHHDIAVMSMYKTDTFCSFTRNFIFKSCFLFVRVRQYTCPCNHLLRVIPHPLPSSIRPRCHLPHSPVSQLFVQKIFP